MQTYWLIVEQLEEASNLHARHVPETGEELAINLLFTGDNSSLSGNCQGTESIINKR